MCWNITTPARGAGAARNCEEISRANLRLTALYKDSDPKISLFLNGERIFFKKVFFVGIIPKPGKCVRNFFLQGYALSTI
jgi:hypothetical protein